MKYLKEYNNQYGDGKYISDNVIQFNVDNITDEVINYFKKEYPDKWVLSAYNYVFIKDKPIPFVDEIPSYVYHVSTQNLLKTGIKPSTKTESPFGYYNLSFFYLNEEDAHYGSIPYIKGKNYLYKVDTDATNNWTNAINEPLDGEDGITTSDFIDPKYIKLIGDENISESKNYPILYHYIPIYNFQKMLEEYKKTGKFLLKTNIETDRSGGNPVVSLSRNPNMNTTDLLLSKQLCRITLDGNLLSNKFKIKPYADSQYTPGSDNEQEEMMYLKNIKNFKSYGYNTHLPDKYQGDITGSILRVDILNFVPEIKRSQGYISWNDKHDDHNPKYYSNNDMNKITIDHQKNISNLFDVVSEIKLPFKIKIVKKFTNYKYQDLFIDKWNKKSFRYNRLS